MTRRPVLRKLKNEKIIFVEGDTEELYFNMLRRRYHGANVTVKIQNKTGQKGSKLVNEALAWRRANAKNTAEIFVCFDDDWQSTAELLASYRLAKKQGIGIIYSDICLEAWLLLHFRTVRQINANWLQKKWLFHQLAGCLGIQKYQRQKARDFTMIYEERLIHACQQGHLLTKGHRLDGDAFAKKLPYTNFHQGIQTIFELQTF